MCIFRSEASIRSYSGRLTDEKKRRIADVVGEKLVVNVKRPSPGAMLDAPVTHQTPNVLQLPPSAPAATGT
jgi:hypothetical protein